MVVSVSYLCCASDFTKFKVAMLDTKISDAQKMALDWPYCGSDKIATTDVERQALNYQQVKRKVGRPRNNWEKSMRQQLERVKDTSETAKYWQQNGVHIAQNATTYPGP